jgi:ubiquinone/menaquinone biosynthesis C-methylase UbiE
MSYPAKKEYLKESVAGDYDRKRFTGWKGRLTHKREMAVMLKVLLRAGVRAPARILDIPCGTGRLSRCLALRGFKMTGLDISTRMIGRGRIGSEPFADRHNIVFSAGDGELLPFRNGEFEAILSLRLFGHTPPETRQRILRELSRVGRRYLVLAFYTKSSLKHYTRKMRRSRSGQEWNPVTVKEMRYELESSGLKLIRIAYLARWFSETMIVLCEKK